jgi:hypothetical protein
VRGHAHSALKSHWQGVRRYFLEKFFGSYFLNNMVLALGVLVHNIFNIMDLVLRFSAHISLIVRIWHWQFRLIYTWAIWHWEFHWMGMK